MKKQNSKTQHRANSVLTPSAQTPSQCGEGTTQCNTNDTITTYLNSLIYTSDTLKLIIELQMRYGCRISEVLNINHHDILTNSRVRIAGLKGSSDRVLQVVTLKDFVFACKSYNRSPFEYISRFYVYREYQKLGISTVMRGNSKASVTHMFRHAHVKELINQGVSLEAIKLEIGHKSIKSTEYYANK